MIPTRMSLMLSLKSVAVQDSAKDQVIVSEVPREGLHLVTAAVDIIQATKGTMTTLMVEIITTTMTLNLMTIMSKKNTMTIDLVMALNTGAEMICIINSPNSSSSLRF